MRSDVRVVSAALACLLLAGCLGGPLPGLSGSAVEEQPLPERPGHLTDDSVLEYAVEYEAVTLHNRIGSEYDASAIAAIETCEYPAEDPQDGALDYWIERRVDEEFYLVLRCPVSIDNRGAEQSGSGAIGKWTTYAITPETTARVELGNNHVRVTNRTVNYDDDPHEVTLSVRPAADPDAEPIVERTYDVAPTSYERIRAIAPSSGTYAVDVTIDGARTTAFEVTGDGGENLLRRVGVYVSPGGEVVVDTRTETNRDR